MRGERLIPSDEGINPVGNGLGRIDMNGKKQCLIAMTLAGLLVIHGTTVSAATIKATGNVNVRTAGSLAGEKIDYILKGQTVEVIGSSDGWFLIDLDGTLGYTYHAFWAAQTVTTQETASVRTAPEQLSDAVFQLGAGVSAEVLGRCGEWLLIEVDGQKGFTHKTFWDADALLYAELPVIEPMELPSGDPGQIINIHPLQGIGTDLVVNTDIRGFASAEAALAGGEPAGVQPAGIYQIRETLDGMIRLVGKNSEEGFWIQPDELEYASGDRYALTTSLPGYMDAASAAAGQNQVVTVNEGIYYIFRLYDGMYNVSTSETTPGAWIDPRLNNQTVPEPIGDQVVAQALQLLGAPYLLGAESWEEGGFDCSGVTHFSYGQLGIDLPRRAARQWELIDTKVTEPRPGDIVAFEKDGEVYHVGLYIGNNQMIHAPKPGAFVKISDLGWWYKNSTVKGFLRPSAATP